MRSSGPLTLAHSTQRAVQVAAGQAAPQERSALRHMFSVYAHGHSELSAFVEAMSAHRREQARLCLGPQFTATALPRPPAGITAFNGFSYMEDPFEVRLPSSPILAPTKSAFRDAHRCIYVIKGDVELLNYVSLSWNVAVQDSTADVWPMVPGLVACSHSTGH